MPAKAPTRPSSRDSWNKLERAVTTCERCARLRQYCSAIALEKKKAFRDWTYWGKPVPNFGDAKARLLIVGLAPAAHGANRTGRMFTGDRSGEWLYRALHTAGFANQARSEAADDGLVLTDCAITAVAHCAPPDNKPLPNEIEACGEYLSRTFDLLEPRVVVALGAIAWNAIFAEFKSRGHWPDAKPAFGHGAEIAVPNGPLILASYHPSQQNTFTGRLTVEMLDSVFAKARAALERAHPRART